MALPFLDMVGRQFGRWRVLAMHPERRRGHICWLCRCEGECGGTERVVSGANLRFSVHQRAADAVAEVPSGKSLTSLDSGLAIGSF
jgi:hypothetical protein